jgi:hypothetical protein
VAEQHRLGLLEAHCIAWEDRWAQHNRLLVACMLLGAQCHQLWHTDCMYCKDRRTSLTAAGSDKGLNQLNLDLVYQTLLHWQIPKAAMCKVLLRKGVGQMAPCMQYLML